MTQVKKMNPKQAWGFMSGHPNAVLIDVRSRLEYEYVGHPTNAVHIPWKEAPEWSINPGFVGQVKSAVTDQNRPVLLLCRSGQRSMAAALALEQSGFTTLINVEEGFEGGLDAEKHRGTQGGWRYYGLPWEQS